MKTRCPACGAAASLDALIAHEGARQALMQAFALSGPLGRLLVRYLALFRPEKRELSLDRVAALLEELLPMLQAGRIERRGRLWPAPLAAWIAALEQLAAAHDQGKLQLPMKSHGYLLEIIAGAANQAEAKEETGREAQRLRDSRARGAAPEQPARAAALVPALAPPPVAPSKGEIPPEVARQLSRYRTPLREETADE